MRAAGTTCPTVAQEPEPMRRRRPRPLSPEDRALWEQIARATRPLHATPPGPPAPPSVDETEPSPTPAQSLRAPLHPFRLGSRTEPGGPSVSVATGHSAEALRMDRKAFTRMRAGKLDPEARIDLHGMTLAEAHPALIGFILRSQAAGHRLVLVITGKGSGEDGGGPIPERRGILKRQVPHWLRQAPVGGAVLQIAQAHRRHGGAGALYAYLRRTRQ